MLAPSSTYRTPTVSVMTLRRVTQYTDVLTVGTPCLEQSTVSAVGEGILVSPATDVLQIDRSGSWAELAAARANASPRVA